MFNLPNSSKIPLFLLITVCTFLLLSCAQPNDDFTPEGPDLLTENSAQTDSSSTDLTSADLADSELANTIDYFEDDCPFAGFEDEDIICGYLTAPEDRTKVDGLTVELAVVTIRSLSDSPHPDPILYLDGGPGGSALVGLADWLESPIRNERDIILFDQRGTGYSWPSLDCAETDALENGEAPEGVEMIEAVEACRDRLRGLGVDLTAYHSAASAADVADLRTAMGFDEWNLFGISYGTRLALTVLRDQPEGVRSVVLDSVYPPNVDAYTEQPKNMADAILALVAGCNADAECGEWYPDLESSLLNAIDTLNESPLDVDGEMVYGDDLVSVLGSALYDSTVIPYLPYVIDEASFGNFDPWLELNEGEEEEEGADQRSRTGLWDADKRGLTRILSHGHVGFRPHLTTFRIRYGANIIRDRQDEHEEGIEDAQGLYYSVECREEAPFGSMEAAEALMHDYPQQLTVPLLAELQEFYDACAIWQAGEAGEIETQPVVSDIPTLILNGEYDPVTPPSWAKLAAETLLNALYVEVPRGGHSVSSDGECPNQLIVDFLNEPMGELDAGCIEEPLPFE